MHFSLTRARAQSATGESPAMLREMIRIYGEKLGNVTTHIKGAVAFGEELPGVSALFTSLSRTEAGALQRLGRLLQNIQIPTLPERDIKPPLRENLTESARAHLEQLVSLYRTQAAQYRRAARLARMEETRHVLTRLEEDANAGADAMLAMHTRLCRS